MHEPIISLIESANWSEAERLAQVRLQEHSEPLYYCLLVKSLEAQGLPERALAGLQQLVLAYPDNISFLLEHARLLIMNGLQEQAISIWLKVLKLAPESCVARFNIAKAFSETGESEKSIAVYEELLQLFPEDDSARYNLANLSQRQGNVVHSVDLYKEILIHNPLHVDAWINIGMAYKSLGKYDESEFCYRRALEIDPENVTAHWNLANLLLFLECWQEGWSEYEWRLRRPEAFSPQEIKDIPVWTGDDLSGKTILLWVEQGAGDAIQFVRFVEILPGPPARVVLYCPPNLMRLLAMAPGVDQVVSYEHKPPSVDCHLSLLSLPERLGLWVSSALRYGAYLGLPPAREKGVPDAVFNGDRLKVGLVWAGNPRHSNDRNRSLKIDDFAEILGVENITFLSLQVFAGGKKAVVESGIMSRMADLEPFLRDFADTAVCLNELDLLITVDTAAAHLAGALELPAWVLLPCDPDWRWSVTGTESLWYPSLRLFRQQRAGEWLPVLAQIKQELLILMESRAVL